MIRPLLCLALLAGLLAAPATGQTDDTGDETGVDSLSVSLTDGVVHVAGAATFVDVPVVVGDDPAGDVLVPWIGADFTQAAIARPDPFGDSLLFTLSVHDQPEGFGGIPEAVCYRWHFQVGDTTHSVQGYRTKQDWSPGSLDPSFRLNRVVVPPLEAGLPLSARMEDGVIEFVLPMSAVGAGPGTVISMSAGGYDGLILAHLLWGGAAGLCPADAMATSAVVLDQMHSLGAYVVPGPSVELGIAPAGTSPEDVALVTFAAVDPDGNFSGTFDLGASPTDAYIVRARACYGASNCGETTVTVAR